MLLTHLLRCFLFISIQFNAIVSLCVLFNPKNPNLLKTPSFICFFASNNLSYPQNFLKGGGKIMVWFQCEDCGDNLKKPKLANHFRMCSANKVFLPFHLSFHSHWFWMQLYLQLNLFLCVCFLKLSCIDCGEIFGRQTVENHTQCISEAVIFSTSFMFYVVGIMLFVSGVTF